jgi:hypothetical protein
MGPPLTHVVHSLITIPVTPILRPFWFGKVSSLSVKSSRANSPVQTPKSRHSDSSSRSNSPLPPKDPKPSAIDRALSVLTAGCRPSSRSSSPLPSTSTTQDALLRAYELVDVSMAVWMIFFAPSSCLSPGCVLLMQDAGHEHLGGYCLPALIEHGL